MGLPLIVIGVSVALAAAASIYALRMAGKQKNTALSPQTLDSFGITQAKEGSVVPLVYGKVRLPGNIIFYGNLESKEIFAEQQSGGSKGFGGGKKSQATGYQYFMDVWQTICLGKCNLLSTYVNNNPQSPDVAETIFNDGTNGLYPDASLVGEYATPLKGVCHVFYRQFNCGENTTQLPTVHFVVERVLTTGVNNENLANGNNPAAIIYDLLKMAGVLDSEIDMTSFNEAADYWYSKGYGLNLIFAEQKLLHEAINTVFSQVDGVFFVNSSGKYAIAAYNPIRTTDFTIPNADLGDFSLRRVSYSQLPNDLRATYVDEDQDFSERVVPFQNDAVIMLEGKINSKSIDLKGFRNTDSASKRLSDIAKYVTYPLAEVNFAVNMKYAAIHPGAIVELSFVPLGVTSAKFRVDSVDLPGVSSLEIKCKATQMAETLFDSNYTELGGSLYEKNVMTPSNYPKYRTEIVLPYTPVYGEEWHTLFFIDREKGYENGFYVETRDGSEPSGPPYLPGADVEGYHTAGFLTTTARRIECTFPVPYLEAGVDPTTYAHYPKLYDHTYTINDSAEGITIFTDGDPLNLTEFPPVDRVGLFTSNRFLYLCHNTSTNLGYQETSYQGEFIAFQNIEAISNPSTGIYSDSSRYHFYKITSFMKGALYTQAKVHELDGLVYPKIGWLFKIGNNILKNAYLGKYRTILPSTLYDVASMADSHPYYPSGKYSVGNYRFRPDWIHGPGRIYAVRSGSTINVRYHPATYTLPGAGHGNPNDVTDSYPFVYEGYLCFKYGANTVDKESPDTEITIMDSNAVTLTVEMSDFKGNFPYISGSLVIGVADGEYVAYTTKNEV